MKLGWVLVVGFVVAALAACGGDEQDIEQPEQPLDIVAEPAVNSLPASAFQFAQPEDDGVDVVPAVLWTLVGVGVVVVAGGALYLLKRQLGAFPRDPERVAPIGGIHSANLPDETTYVDDADAGPPAQH